MSHEIEAKVAKVYTAEGGKNANKFDFASLIEMFFKMFSSSLLERPAAMKRFVRRNPDKVDELLEDRLKDEKTFNNTRDRNAAAVAVRKTFLAMDDDDIKSRAMAA